jgi:hypothetical protein
MKQGQHCTTKMNKGIVTILTSHDYLAQTNQKNLNPSSAVFE